MVFSDVPKDNDMKTDGHTFWLQIFNSAVLEMNQGVQYAISWA